MTCRCRAKCATDAFTLQAPEMILMESIVPTTEICLTFAELRPPRVLVAGARAKYVLANRRVVKRDCDYRRFLFFSIYIYILFIIPLTALSSAAA